jgi:hypothetical protein
VASRGRKEQRLTVFLLFPHPQLESLKKMRNKDGKFEVAGDVPHGQLALEQKLLECDKLVDELRREA